MHKFAAALLALALVTPPQTALGQNALPRSEAAAPQAVRAPAARAAFDEYLAAFNAADPEAMRQFKERYGYDKTVEGVLAFRGYTGGFDLVRIEEQSESKMAAIVRWRDGEMVEERRTLVLAEGPPRSLTIEGEKLPIERLTQAEAVAGFIRRSDELAASGRFSGTVLLARHGKILFARAYGEADRERHVPMTLDSQIRYGSLGKMFTAIALLQLVEAGKVDLDAPVAAYLPGYPNREFATKVKVRHLLTHESGAGGIDTVDIDWDGNRSGFKTLDDYVAHYGDRAPEFEPGSKVEYSNYAFIVAGKIVEAVTARDFYEVVQKQIFDPAGMTRTGYAPETVTLPGRAVPYTERDGALVSVLDRYPWRGIPAGGGYSTVTDLFRFSEALRSGKLLSRDLLRQATSPQNLERWYGYGFITVGEPGTLRYGHGGDAPGSNASFTVFPESGWVTIALANRDPQIAYRAHNWFEPRMPIDDGGAADR